MAAFNRAARVAARLGVRTSLKEASLVAAARRATGLEFFGDGAFREPMRRLLASVESEARLHPMGRIMARAVFVRNLANRLRIEGLRDTEPEIFRLPVDRPVFIVGLQRTGTTLLQRLLARHPALRALQSWEAVNPLPLLERRRAPGAPDPRIRLTEWAERAARYMAPDFFAIHPIEARGQEEDSLVFDPSFWSTTAEAMMHVPTFTAWLESVDDRPAYRAYREVIQILLWQRPGRWLGKTPLHLEHLETLIETFPDASILHTHRDPVETVASLCSMIAHGRGFFSDHVDAREIGTEWLARSRRTVERALAARARLGDGAFLDVDYRGLMEDPMKELARIGEFIGAPLDAEAQAAMRAFLRENPQHKHGRHQYRLEDFGLEATGVAAAFAGYRERFGLGIR